MIDYSKGVIYTVKSPSNPHINPFYGSTTKPLYQRKCEHKHAYDNYTIHQIGWYVPSFELFQFPDTLIELVEQYPCQSNEQLLTREKEYVLKYECVNNQYRDKSNKSMNQYFESHKNTINKTPKQYRDSHKSEIQQKSKQYRDSHKNEIKQKAKIYRESHKIEIKQKSKKYRESHKSEIQQKSKQYRDSHKNEIKQKAIQYREPHKNESKQNIDSNTIGNVMGCIMSSSIDFVLEKYHKLTHLFETSYQ